MANGWLAQHSNIDSEIGGCHAGETNKKGKKGRREEKRRDKKTERDLCLSLSISLSNPSTGSFWDDWNGDSVPSFQKESREIRYGSRGGESFKGFSSPSDGTDEQQSSVRSSLQAGTHTHTHTVEWGKEM